MSHILVIDDDEQVLTMLKMTLEAAGYEVTEAQNGKVGIKLLRETSVDLIIIDIIMPEKEGIETIIEIRRDFPEIKIIAISGGGRLSANGYLNLAERMGVQRTFLKPMETRELLDATAELVGNSFEP